MEHIKITTFPAFFEPQEDRLCGKHALNNLYQEEIFTKTVLDQIAEHLNTEEIEIERIIGEQEDIGRVRNYTARGDYTIQVLIRAVLMVSGRDLVSLASRDERAIRASRATRDEIGFILCEGAEGGQSGHWYCLRRIGENWFKIDSTEKRGPERLRVHGNQVALLATDGLRKKYTGVYVLV